MIYSADTPIGQCRQQLLLDLRQLSVCGDGCDWLRHQPDNSTLTQVWRRLPGEYKLWLIGNVTDVPATYRVLIDMQTARHQQAVDALTLAYHHDLDMEHKVYSHTLSDLHQSSDQSTAESHRRYCEVRNAVISQHRTRLTEIETAYSDSLMFGRHAHHVQEERILRATAVVNAVLAGLNDITAETGSKMSKSG